MPLAKLILDTQSLDSAAFDSGTKIRTYDDGSGPLWIARDSMGVDGIIRADTWEDAYEIWEDEMAPEADEATMAAMAKECDYTGHADGLLDDAIFQENYGFRPNGRNSTDKIGHGIYAKDLNGNHLDALSPELVERLGIVLTLSERGCLVW